MLWRAERGQENRPAPPQPWPGRYDAFLYACALHAGQRERDLLEVVRAFGGAGESEPATKQMNPARAAVGGLWLPPGMKG